MRCTQSGIVAEASTVCRRALLLKLGHIEMIFSTSLAKP